jgi:hypothetical protein
VTPLQAAGVAVLVVAVLLLSTGHTEGTAASLRESRREV